MIDKRKNVCYVIHVQSVDENGDRFTQKFLSQHGITTKTFKKFAENYLRKKNCRIYSQMNGEYEWGTQFTVSLDYWKDKEKRKRVLEGITENEKCY